MLVTVTCTHLDGEIQGKMLHGTREGIRFARNCRSCQIFQTVLLHFVVGKGSIMSEGVSV